MKTTNSIREITSKEIQEVNGGFLGAIIALAVAIVSGCATMPNKAGHEDK